MTINVSGINTNLNESVLYEFTGTLISQEYATHPVTSVILIRRDS